MAKVLRFPGVVLSPAVTASGEENPVTPQPLADSERVRRLERHLLRMNEFLGRLPESRSETFRMRDELLSRCTDQELLTELEDSNEINWRPRPAYYRALAMLLRDRGLLGEFGHQLDALADMLEDGEIVIE